MECGYKEDGVKKSGMAGWLAAERRHRGVTATRGAGEGEEAENDGGGTQLAAGGRTG